ncbi:MAG TPA: hypothetical protein VJ717_21275 [Gemmatimonadaceae bacterium]|nr:hypothetical protein [Gemmatimonadaceae bacterium]
MSKRFVGIAVLLLTGVTTKVDAQRHELPARLKLATREAVTALADSLGAAGLPARAVYDKAAEGALKNASDAQILSAVRGLARRLRDSRAVLGADASDEALLAASSALYAGVPPAVIRRAADARGDKATAPSLALTLTVLGSLVSRQVPVELAAGSIEALLKRGARDFDLQQFHTSIEGDIQGGGSPSEATAARTQNILNALNSRRPPGEG